MRIAMLASESNPFCKSGGLADVVFALSKELVKEGNEVIVLLPYHGVIKRKSIKVTKKGSYVVKMSWRQQDTTLYETAVDGVKFYFVENDAYFYRDHLYGYDDDGERFAYFALAAKAALKHLKFKADIVHVHDWQTAMVPCLLKEEKPADPFYKDMKSVLTIHNPAFKGFLDRFFLNDFFNLRDELYDTGKVRLDGLVSTLKAGIVFADKITTVSPTHRNELLTFEHGQGLDRDLELRRYDFTGIANGIDIEEWDPSKDKGIARNFDVETVKEGKKANQKELLDFFHITNRGGPVYGIVSRLSWQKGIDIMINNMREALARGASLLILGSGEYELEQKCEALRRDFPDTCGIYIGYNDAIAHKIYAGCDYFLMPSLFEPCGISQMIAKRYGTLPIVRYTGGLADTVVGYNKDNLKVADGIGFNDYNDSGLGYAVGLSRELFEDKKAFWTCVKNAMKCDHSWKNSANEYLKIYHSLAS
ncbi:MAG: glycogen synthase [Bacilli bacterium]|nr:glycogen synthase [Bacilli bacterium]